MTRKYEPYRAVRKLLKWPVGWFPTHFGEWPIRARGIWVIKLGGRLADGRETSNYLGTFKTREAAAAAVDRAKNVPKLVALLERLASNPEDPPIGMAIGAANLSPEKGVTK